MKIEKFREMTQDDLKRKLIELSDTLMKTKVKIQTKQVENTAQLSALRHDIARVKTLLREMDLKGSTAPTAAAAAPVAKAESKEKKPAVKEKAGVKGKK